MYYACITCNTAWECTPIPIHAHCSYVQCHVLFNLLILVLISVLCMQPHRVLLPDDEVKQRTVRQCVTFLHPDNDVLMF